MVYYFKACQRCTGDLCEDGDELKCVQCGRVYYSHEIETGGVRRKEEELPDIGVRDQRWIDQNRVVVGLFVDGLSVQQVCRLLDKSESHIGYLRDIYLQILTYRNIT